MCANITSGEYPRGVTAKTGLLYPVGSMKNQKSAQSEKESCEVTNSLAVAELTTVDAIRSRIFTTRDAQVMLDRDLAELYGVEVGQLNRQVKRNIERFPEDFMFQLTHEECSRCQIGILNGGRGSNIKYLPYVFTENGIAMLSSVLRSPRAIAANIRIMRAFTAMRRALASLAPLLSRIEATERRQLKQENAQVRNEERFKLILDAMQDKKFPPDKFHDRFLIIDKTTLIHVGASLNHLGKKCFAFSSLDRSNIPDILAKF